MQIQKGCPHIQRILQKIGHCIAVWQNVNFPLTSKIFRENGLHYELVFIECVDYT